MDNLINFPTWIIEKERHLSKLECDLAIERLSLEKEKSKVRQAKFDLLFRNILCFLSGTFFGMALLSML